jgi:hypothetical protein
MVMRLIILGSARAGKTTEAKRLGLLHNVPVFSSDDLIGTHAWGDDSRHIVDNWFTREGDWIIEGCSVPRAVRKFLADPSLYGTPIPWQTVVTLWHPYVELSKGQASQRKSNMTIWAQCQEMLLERA